MSDNISVRFTETEFLQPCSLCPYMKQVTLEQTLEAVRGEMPEVDLDPEVAEAARRSVERMFDVAG